MSVHITTTKYGQRYLGNSNEKEVHDLHSETAVCQIDEILRANHAVRFSPDAQTEAHRNGYDNCHWCIGDSKR